MSRILSSWKEIAQYLGKGIRTVQRWEHCGLPIRRPKPDSNIIIAFTDEIDSWLTAGGSDAFGRMKARVSELEAEIARMTVQFRMGNKESHSDHLPAHCKCQDPRSISHQSSTELGLLLATASQVRVAALVAQIKTATTLCESADVELAYGETAIAAKLVQKLKRAAERIRHHLAKPEHITSNEAIRLRKDAAHLLKRIRALESQLARSVSDISSSPQPFVFLPGENDEQARF